MPSISKDLLKKSGFISDYIIDLFPGKTSSDIVQLKEATTTTPDSNDLVIQQNEVELSSFHEIAENTEEFQEEDLQAA